MQYCNQLKKSNSQNDDISFLCSTFLFSKPPHVTIIGLHHAVGPAYCTLMTMNTCPVTPCVTQNL